MLKQLAAVLVVLLPASLAQAGEAGDITRDALYAGDLAGGLTRLGPLAEAGDSEAAFGSGFLTFVSAVEGLAQGLYRHGIVAPETGAFGPRLTLPLPPNPTPEPLDYAKVRAILERLVTDLDRATAQLLAGGESGDYVMLIDPLKVRIDVNGDGAAEETETIGNVFEAAFGLSRPSAMRPTEPPGPPGTPPAPVTLDRDSSIGFDRADAIWLAGYSQVFAAQADFLLAHDFEAMVDATFHRFFPRAGLPMQEYAAGGMLLMEPETDGAFADAIAFVHLLNWRVEHPTILARVLERFSQVTSLSRRNWEAILAETDDSRELVPSPRQTSIVPDGKVTEEMVAAWLETLDVADKVLAGELLVPHWRFSQGFDLHAYFTTADHTDLVMLLTGYDAIPYLRDGPIATAESFAAANRVFGDDFLGYAFWFN
jgi:hypothetical protein